MKFAQLLSGTELTLWNQWILSGHESEKRKEEANKRWKIY